MKTKILYKLYEEPIYEEFDDLTVISEDLDLLSQWIIENLPVRRDVETTIEQFKENIRYEVIECDSSIYEIPMRENKTSYRYYITKVIKLY